MTQQDITRPMVRGCADHNGEWMGFCELLSKDPKVTAQPGWTKLVLIGEAGTGRARMFGYSYNADGACRLMAPNVDMLLAFRSLYRSMHDVDPSGRPWVACMIRLSAAGDAALEFEYDDSQRWDHTPANYERRIAEYAALEV